MIWDPIHCMRHLHAFFFSLRCFWILLYFLMNVTHWDFLNSATRRTRDVQRSPLEHIAGVSAAFSHTCIADVMLNWNDVNMWSINYTIIALDNDSSSDRRQAIICTNAGLLLNPRMGTSFGEIWIKIQQLFFQKFNLKMSTANCFVLTSMY